MERTPLTLQLPRLSRRLPSSRNRLTNSTLLLSPNTPLLLFCLCVWSSGSSFSKVTNQNQLLQAYQELREGEGITLPSVVTLKKMIRNVGDPSSQDNSYLKGRFDKLTEKERNVALLMDEIYVDKRLELFLCSLCSKVSFPVRRSLIFPSLPVKEEKELHGKLIDNLFSPGDRKLWNEINTTGLDLGGCRPIDVYR